MSILYFLLGLSVIGAVGGFGVYKLIGYLQKQRQKKLLKYHDSPDENNDKVIFRIFSHSL